MFMLAHIFLALQVLFASGQVILERNSGLENWFPNNVLTTLGVVKSAIECGILCKQAECMSIVYETIDRICHLNDRVTNNVSDYSWKLNTRHYSVVSGIINGYDCDIIDDSCLKVLSSKLSWTAGSAECGSEGAQLLNIDSSNKQLAIQQFMADKGLDHVWLGINDITQEGDWRTEDGTNPIAYQNFNAGQPDNYYPGQDCGLITQNFGYLWDDGVCQQSVNVVCERKKVGSL
ncbi:brevican core protein-like [Pecten maximus]|uniref:brevican core protein-like n=1 Tax=Pecten maximus TaxID=6579 RepID=UPI0014581A75|nr:brevican core protein-like [Pecten maximus]